MASPSTSRLQQAANAVNTALATLEKAVQTAEAARASSSQSSEARQAEIAAGWQVKLHALEDELAGARAEIAHLKEENQRIGNQLQVVMHEHVELQKNATHTVAKLNASVSQLDLLLEQRA